MMATDYNMATYLTCGAKSVIKCQQTTNSNICNTAKNLMESLEPTA
uniref:Uncharacterized protein n=1 Tax=Arundo donax TaxID=35708 RepID=A0A0A9T9V5_ARUDO